MKRLTKRITISMILLFVIAIVYYFIFIQQIFFTPKTGVIVQNNLLTSHWETCGAERQDAFMSNAQYSNEAQINIGGWYTFSQVIVRDMIITGNSEKRVTVHDTNGNIIIGENGTFIVTRTTLVKDYCTQYACIKATFLQAPEHSEQGWRTVYDITFMDDAFQANTTVIDEDNGVVDYILTNNVGTNFRGNLTITYSLSTILGDITKTSSNIIDINPGMNSYRTTLNASIKDITIESTLDLQMPGSNLKGLNKVGDNAQVCFPCSISSNCGEGMDRVTTNLYTITNDDYVTLSTIEFDPINIDLRECNVDNDCPASYECTDNSCVLITTNNTTNTTANTSTTNTTTNISNNSIKCWEPVSIIQEAFTGDIECKQITIQNITTCDITNNYYSTEQACLNAADTGNISTTRIIIISVLSFLVLSGLALIVFRKKIFKK